MLGAAGQVGSELCRGLRRRGLPVVGLPRDRLDLCRLSVERVRGYEPDWILNAAAYTAVDQAEADPDGAYAVNRNAVRLLGRIARELQVPVLHFSTDYVLDGQSSSPVSECAVPAPLSTYGRSKLEGERVLLEEQPDSIVLRVGWVFGPTGRNFVKTIVRLGMEKSELRIVSDQRGCPTSAANIAETVFRILKADIPRGLYHYTNGPACSWHEFAVTILARARSLGLPIRARDVIAIGSQDYPTAARRPLYSVLDDARLRRLLPKLPLEWLAGLDDTILATARGHIPPQGL